MAVKFDNRWYIDSDERVLIKNIYRGGELIGRVKFWREHEVGSAIREWFTSEIFFDNNFVTIRSAMPDFFESLNCIADFDMGEITNIQKYSDKNQYIMNMSCATWTIIVLMRTFLNCFM